MKLNMSVEDKFANACAEIKKFAKRPSDEEMLEIYSLYKQATIGDCNIPKPEQGDEAKAKWNVWNGKRGLTQNSAKEQYVAKVEVLGLHYY